MGKCLQPSGKVGFEVARPAACFVAGAMPRCLLLGARPRRLAPAGCAREVVANLTLGREAPVLAPKARPG